MTYFRAKAYQTFGLPGRPKVHIDILYGPWKESRPPARILAEALGKCYPNLTPTVQSATRG